jgi:hypothetical protein
VYDTWREKNIASLLAHLRTNNIHSIGRYGAWQYASMQEAVLEGKQTAEFLNNSLKKQQEKTQPRTINLDTTTLL